MAFLPQFGDVVIHKVHDSATKTPYGVGLFAGPVQFLAVSHSAARDRAAVFARQNRLDLWYTEDAQTYSCVARCRDVMLAGEISEITDQ